MTDTVLRRRFTDRWILPLSLLFNFFALGVLASTFAPGMHGMHTHMHASPIERMVRGLPDADAQKLRAVYAADEPAIEANRETLKTSMQKITAILAEPTPDQAELQQTLDDITAAQSKIHDSMADIVRHAATDLSPEGRQALAEHGLQGYVRHN